MTNKGFTLFDYCAAECVYLCPQEVKRISSSWRHSKIYTPGTIANSQTDQAPTEINKNGAVAKVRILVELGML